MEISSLPLIHYKSRFCIFIGPILETNSVFNMANINLGVFVLFDVLKCDILVQISRYVILYQ